VHLTAAATDRLGGPAWLDVAAVQRAVGALYPLYREPGHHTVARVLGGRGDVTVQ
jgi:ribosomal protein S12 methylthiotransferase accessory factor